MLAYAANAPRHAERQSSPNALLIVIGLHVAVVAAVMSAKMELPVRPFDPPPKVISIPLPPEPPANPVASAKPQPAQTHATSVQTQVDLPPPDRGPIALDAGPSTGGGTLPTPNPLPLPLPIVAKSGPALLTPAAELRPPYPRVKVLTEEEAVLRLRLAIDERGRVVAVEPLGRADPVFLEAARRHLVAHWRYRPASEDGRAIASSTVVTLHFQLD